MKVAVFSHKLCWPSEASPSGYATDGGFPFQMEAISEIFQRTRLLVPVEATPKSSGEIALKGCSFEVVPLTPMHGQGLRRKLWMLPWLLRNGLTLLRELQWADAIHAAIPGDVGTVGMVLAVLRHKRLLVRHCGNWAVQRTPAERFWRWFMERFASGQNVMLATGGAVQSPSELNSHIKWIFSTSLREEELRACARERQWESRPNPRLVIVCRQEKTKGVEVVLRSLPLLRDTYPGVGMDVGGDGPDLAEFQRLAGALDISDRVTFHGRLSHQGVLEILRQADLFCLPTSSEGFPKVVLEALACGLPVITMPVSVLAELPKAGCGVLLPNASPEALARAVRSCLSDPQRYHNMSVRAIETARAFSLERWRDMIARELRLAWGPFGARA